MIDLPLCKEKRIAVSYLPGFNAEAVAGTFTSMLYYLSILILKHQIAELVLGLTLAISRRITEQASLIKSGKVIISTDYVAVGLNKKTIGLVGMGDTAREVALKFRGAFGCRILVYSPTSPMTRCESLRYDTSIHRS